MTRLHLGHPGISYSDYSHHPCLPQEFEKRVGAAHMVQKTLQARAAHYSTVQGGSQKGSHPAEAWWPMSLNRGPHSSTGGNPTEKSTPSLQLLTVERDQYPQQLLNICKSWGLRGLEPSVTLVTVYKSSMRGREQSATLFISLASEHSSWHLKRARVTTATATVQCLTAWRALCQRRAVHLQDKTKHRPLPARG